MKNIPLFTTPYGVATLILSEIPSSQIAYVNVRTVTDLEALLAECTQFCRMCGAESIYGTGEGDWFQYPMAYEEWEYQMAKGNLPTMEATLDLVPVTSEQAKTYEMVYNQAFQTHVGTPQHPYGTTPEHAFLAYENQTFLGLGQVTDNTLQTIVSTVKGKGYPLSLALLEKTKEETITLQVMSYNASAIALYERLGFSKVAVLHKYFKIL